MALLNNWLELRSDAFKIAHQFRRPIPTRTDTIGPWLEALVRSNNCDVLILWLTPYLTGLHHVGCRAVKYRARLSFPPYESRRGRRRCSRYRTRHLTRAHANASQLPSDHIRSVAARVHRARHTRAASRARGVARVPPCARRGTPRARAPLLEGQRGGDHRGAGGSESERTVSEESRLG